MEFSTLINALSASKDWLWFGIEREGLRAANDGKLATTYHPSTLGAKLTHPHITTDFGEAQPELITQAFSNPEDTLDELAKLHAWLISQTKNEFLWPSSMPCLLPEKDENIAIADFGKCHKGQLKYIYRYGLSLRYGRAMQLVSGLHCNFSFDTKVLDKLAQARKQSNTQAWRNQHYFSVMRNYRRYAWVIHYLLGASPVIDSSMAKLSHTIDVRNFYQCNDMLFGKDATTLRQSDIGYVSTAQRNANMCFGSVESWVEGVDRLVHSSYPPFESIGIEKNGNHMQLGHGLLQIENEYYTCIRPKRSNAQGLRPLLALANYGVEYLEIRNLDCNPFAPCGIDIDTLYFMALFFLWCTTQDFRPLGIEDCAAAEHNDRCSATFGRNHTTALITTHLDSALAKLPCVYIFEGVQWVCDQLEKLAKRLCQLGKPQYAQALHSVRKRGPISRLVEQDCLQKNYITSCLTLAKKHQRHFPTLSEATIQEYQQQAMFSQQRFNDLEREHLSTSITFRKYFNAYLQGKTNA